MLLEDDFFPVNITIKAICCFFRKKHVQMEEVTWNIYFLSTHSKKNKAVPQK